MVCVCLHSLLVGFFLVCCSSALFPSHLSPVARHCPILGSVQCSVLHCVLLLLLLFLLFSKLNVVFFSLFLFFCFCCFVAVVAAAAIVVVVVAVAVADIYALQRKYAKCRDTTKYESNIM